MKSRKHDAALIGKQVGKWHVLERAEDHRKRDARFRCQCACGTISIVNAWDLSNGKTLGCMNCARPSYDIVKGRQYGTWIVGEKNERYHWNCTCVNCGVVKEINR